MPQPIVGSLGDMIRIAFFTFVFVLLPLTNEVFARDDQATSSSSVNREEPRLDILSVQWILPNAALRVEYEYAFSDRFSLTMNIDSMFFKGLWWDIPRDTKVSATGGGLGIRFAFERAPFGPSVGFRLGTLLFGGGENRYWQIAYWTEADLSWTWQVTKVVTLAIGGGFRATLPFGERLSEPDDPDFEESERERAIDDEIRGAEPLFRLAIGIAF